MEIYIEGIGKEQDNFLKFLEKGEEIWCTEERLGEILKKLYPSDEIIHNRKLILSNKFSFRPDYFLPDRKMVVEFQGPRHYMELDVMYKDVVKRNNCAVVDVKMIEFPYFVQPTVGVLKHLFSDLKEIDDFSNGFPHGFIHPNAPVPGSFSLLGLKRLFADIKSFPEEVLDDIMFSLCMRSEVTGIPLEFYIAGWDYCGNREGDEILYSIL